MSTKVKQSAQRRKKGTRKTAEIVLSEPIGDEQMAFATPSRESGATSHRESLTLLTSQIYSTPQTYASGVTSCGLGSNDWGCSTSTESQNLFQFAEMMKRHPVLLTLYSPLDESLESRSSSVPINRSDSSSSSEDPSLFRSPSKRIKRVLSTGFLSSPDSLFSSSCSVSPPPPHLNHFFHKANSFQRKCSIDEFDTAEPMVCRSHSASPPVTEKKKKNTCSPFYDILHESPPSSHSSPTDTRIANEVAQFFYQSFSALHPQLFPSVDLFNDLALQYLSLSPSSVTTPAH
jgi:hypothetical protein